MEFDASISRRSLLAALATLPASRLLRGQEPAKPPTTFSTGVKVVNVLANVRNKQGEIVKDLTKDDFRLDEDGVPQQIKYFAQESDLPLSLGLLVDTSGSQRRLIGEERSASYQFFQQVLREDKDVAFVIHFDFEVELLQDITSSRTLLEKALENLEAPQQLRRNRQTGTYPGGGGGGYPGGIGFPGGGRGRRGGRGTYPGGGGRGGGGTDLYDAVMLASDEVMKKQTGRKAIILLTDGVDTGSKVSLTTAIEAAQRADTLVYGILFEDPEMYGGGFGGGGGRRIPLGGRGGVNGKKVLDQISRETGGRMFEVSKKQPLSKVYQQIEDDLRHQYSLGYSPERTDNNTNYRRIHLTTRQKGLIVQTREGYYPS